MESHPAARLLTIGTGYPMDPQTTGQMRPPYADLCRPPCTDASTLSAYHGRYLPSMPLSTGSSFPFLGGMFTGSLPGPPTSPFRTPSTPGVNNMRQFWPPTPPPDGGYGRLALNTNLFPLFGASPDSGAFLTQGLVSRLGSTTHLSPLIDHKEHSFFSHGIGLGTPLTPTGHVTSPSPFPHLIPSLERHPVYGGHMTLGSKELEDLQHEADDGRLMKAHMDCLNIPSSRPKTKHDGKNCCDKTVDDCCKLSQSCMPSDNVKSHDEMQNISSKKHLTHKVQPCKIEVSHSPTIKHDLLSPPIDSPRSDMPSPNRCYKKTSHSPFGTDPAPVPVTRASYEEKSQTRCSQCCANIKDVGVATKLGASELKDNSVPVTVSQPALNCVIPLNSPAPAVSSCASTTPVSATVNAVSNNASHLTCVNVESKVSYENESSSCSPVIAVKNVSDKQSFCKSNTNEDDDCEENDGDNVNNYNNINTEPSLCKSSNNLNVTAKHVTAAVIPTAPKQLIHRDVHPENNSSRSVNDSLKNVVTSASDSSVFVVKEQKSFCTDHCVKVELESSNEKALPGSNNLLNSTNGSFVNRPLNKNLATSCKVKDMIKNVCNAKQVQHNSLLKSSENFDATKTPPESPSPKTVSTCAVSLAVSPTVMSKSPSKNMVKMQYVPAENVRKCSPFKEDMPVMKNESGSNRLDCEFSQKNNNSTKWTKATVSPFTWQGNNSQDDQAINLTVTKKVVKPEPNETVAISESSDVLQDNLIKTSENSYTTPTSNVIGVCHPNQNPIAINKMKNSPTVSSVNNYSSISVLNQPTSEQSTEVHILHRSSKSSFPLVSRNGASPVPLKSTISHVTANTSIHRSLKTERLMAKRGKISEMDKLSHTGRTTLATLAPKLSKNVNFGKDMQSSHTISASSSVSSTSIVFPATVNPCIPVGIAIAQQRQDSSTSASIGKSQASVPSSTPNALSTTSHLSTNHVAADIQTQEIIRDQKSQDLPISNNATPVDTSLLVAQGPTIVSRQWESEALTRTAALPSSWVAHGSIVAPAVWLGQGAYTAPAAPTTNTVPNVAMNSIESSPISLPPGGYQLARDSITGHLLLIPTANIELMDRGPSVWPAFNSTAGNMPIQQLVTQQQHTQFEQVLPQPEPFKTADPGDTSCNITTCDIASNTAVKTEETKMEDLSGQVPSVPLATGQTYAFTTFPTQCDPSGFSYVLQSSTVMHLAHTQTTASIQTESGRRSQATSPLHCATPSPPPNTCSVQVSAAEEEESENESDMECCENNQQQVTNHIQSVTTAIQVDMDSQTNSEEEEDEESKITVLKSDALKVEMSDSANQTESVPSESPKSEPDVEDMEIVSDSLVVKEETSLQSPVKTDSDAIPAISLKEDDSVPVETGLEIVTSETELAPSLPVESKPVMDFIDHHGLNLLVDSIEEFASREQETQQVENQEEKIEELHVANEEPLDTDLKSEAEDTVPKPPEPQKFAQTVTVPPKSFSSNFKTLDTTVTDGLGLLCALAEQRFFEEALNDDSKAEEPKSEVQKTENKKSMDNPSIKECSSQSNSSASSAISSICSSPSQREVSEMEMRLQIEELQKKYKQKQRELELLRKSKGKEMIEEESCIAYSQQKSFETAPVSSAQNTPVSTYPVSQNQTISSCEASSDSNSSSNDSETNKKSAEETDSNIPKQNVSSVKPVHVSTQLSHSDTNVSNSSGVCSEASSQSNEDVKTDKDNLLGKKTSFSCPESTFERNGKGNKTPFFDEQAWFVRRSERIFLSDAKPVATTPASGSSQDKSTKKATTSSNKGSADNNKEKKEHTVKLKTPKSLEETPVKKSRSKTLKPKNILSKKRLLSTSSDSDSSSDEKSSEGESSDAASCTSENLPLSTLVEHSSSTKLLERQKRLSTDSEYSSGQSDDLPLSVLLEQKIPELPSCILKPEALQENARLLVLDEGLFYAGYITKSEDADIYGILIDGDRAARPHMFSKEEILNAAVLEVKPSHKQQLPEGSRICAFWSQQYRCLYPGTVTKASSPLTDPSLLYVEFDDGDRGRIPLNDIRMLPSDFPIVSLEPNPFMILGKRRARTQSQNNVNGNSDIKHETPKSDKTEHKKQKSLEKMSKKNPVEAKVHKEKLKSKSPSAVNRSRSSSKSSVTGHGDGKQLQNSSNKKESSEEKKKSETKSKHSEKKSKDTNNTDPKSILKPKKHKKHKEDHHKHHHHHHKHHHHKKHKTEKTENSSSDTVINSNLSTNKDSSNSLSPSNAKASEQEYDSFILENSKSDLTMKIKKSPSPHTNHEELLNSKKKHSVSSSSSSEDDDDEPPTKKQKKSKLVSSPSKRKERVPSVEKSKIAAFLPDRQLWRWSGKSFRRPGAKGKAKKEFYRSIQRGKESIKVGDCAVFLSTGRPHLPYIGRIETMWESWGGKMDVKVKWFYHPEETKSGKKLSQLKGALFQSPHFDENDVQTISHKCEVLSWSEYQQQTASENVEDNNDTYFLAGTYDPIMGTLILEPGVPNISASNLSEP